MLRGGPALYCADSLLLILISRAGMSTSNGQVIEAAQRHNVDELNDLIRSNAFIQEEMALQGAGHKPLHVGCVAGHLNFIPELLK